MIGLDVILAKPDGKARGDKTAPDEAESGKAGAPTESSEGWIEALTDATDAAEGPPQEPQATETTAAAPNAAETFIFRQDLLAADPTGRLTEEAPEGENIAEEGDMPEVRTDLSGADADGAAAAANPDLSVADAAAAEKQAPDRPRDLQKTDLPLNPEEPQDSQDQLGTPKSRERQEPLERPLMAEARQSPAQSGASEVSSRTESGAPAALQKPAETGAAFGRDKPAELRAPTEVSPAPSANAASSAPTPADAAAQTPVQSVRPTFGADPAPDRPSREAPRRETLSSEALASIRKEYGGAIIAPATTTEAKAPTPSALATPGLSDSLGLSAFDAAAGDEEAAPIGKLEAASTARGAAAERPVFAPPSPQLQAQAGAIAAQIRVAFAASNTGRIDIRLDPPELGRLSVTISAQDDVSAAIVSAERPEVVDILRRHGDMLTRDLEAAGFANLSLEFANSGESGEAGDEGAETEGASQAADPRDGAERSLSVAAVGDRLDIRL